MVLTRELLMFWTLSREAAKGVHIFLNNKLKKIENNISENTNICDVFTFYRSLAKYLFLNFKLS
jgi:hypothetical protein